MAFVSVIELNDAARVTLADCYGFGVIWLRLEDAKGRLAIVCLDCRVGSLTQNRLFEKAQHPNKPGATLLELGGEEEGIAIPLISRWLDSDEPREGGYREEWIEAAKLAFTRVGEPA